MKTKISNLLLLTAMIALPLSVNAEEVKPSDFNEEKTVVVGDVDVTVYSVDIEWGDLSYDWKYDKETNSFGFKAPLGCNGYVASSEEAIENFESWVSGGQKMYSDNTCTTLHTGEFEIGNTYYQTSKVGGKIRVVDNSVNGKIKAKVGFTPASSYDWVIGKFYAGYTLTPATGLIEYQNELTDNYLPVTPGLSIRALDGYLKLDVNNEYTGEKVVEQGSTIGTVTLEISEDTN